MFALDLFNNDHERRLAEGAVDRLEQRRIDDLAMKMDDLVARAKTATTPEVKQALMKEFQKCKAERDSYYKIRNETMGYGTLVGEGQMKQMMHKDAERMSREAFCEKYGNEEWVGEFWDNVSGPLDEAGIGQDIVNKTEKMARATPPTKAGAVASTVKNAAKWLAGKGGPGQEGPTYESAQKKNSEVTEEQKEFLYKVICDGYDKGNFVNKNDAIFSAQYMIYYGEKEYTDIKVIELKTGDAIWEWHGTKDDNDVAPTEIEVDEGWSDAIVAQRTGRPRTPYSVYIKGKKWKDFENDDHAEAVANKLRAKFKADGRDPSVITIAPTDYDKNLKEFAPGGIYKPPVIPTNPGKGPFEDDPRSQTVNQVQQLLDAGKSVFVLLPGAKGRAVGTQIGDDHSWLNVQYKGWKDPKTRSRSRLTVNLKADDDASLTLTPGSQFTDNKDRPFDYTLTGSAKTSGRGLFEVTVDEADETSWTANSAQFRKEEDMSWPVEITLEPKADVNKGRGRQVKTMTVTGQSRDAAKKKLVDYFRKNGWAVTGIKFTGDLDESDSGDYDYPYNMSARDKGRYDAMTGREYNNPYSAFGTQEDHNNAIEYSAAYDSANEQGVAEAETDYSKRRQREKDIDAGKPIARQRQSKMTDYQKRRAQQKKEMELGEDYNNESRDAVESAIIRRIMVAHTDLLKKFGPQKVMDAAQAVADEHSDVEEIGTSDVSAFVQQVERYLAMNY